MFINKQQTLLGAFRLGYFNHSFRLKKEHLVWTKNKKVQTELNFSFSRVDEEKMIWYGGTESFFQGVFFVFMYVDAFMAMRVFSCLLELNVKPISKPLIQLVLEIYWGASIANL